MAVPVTRADFAARRARFAALFNADAPRSSIMRTMGLSDAEYTAVYSACVEKQLLKRRKGRVEKTEADTLFVHDSQIEASLALSALSAERWLLKHKVCYPSLDLPSSRTPRYVPIGLARRMGEGRVLP